MEQHADKVNCYICFEPFHWENAEHIPRIVPCCGRSICSKCCARLFVKANVVWELKCPFGCPPIRLPTADIGNLRANRTFMEMLEQHEKLKEVQPVQHENMTNHEGHLRQLCEVCTEKRPAVWFCENDQIAFCDICKVEQHQMKVSRLHKIFAIVEKISQSSQSATHELTNGFTHSATSSTSIHGSAFIEHKHRHIFVAERDNHRISVFQLSDGTFEHFLGNGEGNGAGQLQSPFGLSFSLSTNTLAVNELRNNRVSLFRVRDDAANFDRHIDLNKKGESPWDICINSSEQILYVSIHGDNSHVGLFSLSTGKWVKDIGIGVLSWPSGICFHSTTSELFVSDYNKNRISVFNLLSGSIRFVGVDGHLSRPKGLCISAKNRTLFVAHGNLLSSFPPLVSAYDILSGDFLMNIGEGMLEWPMFLCVDDNLDLLYISDRSVHCVFIFTSLTGAYLHRIGKGRIRDPCGICLI